MAEGTERRERRGWSMRWDEVRARDAYAAGWWARETIADLLARAAADEPERVLVIDGDTRLAARELHARAERLARALLGRMPTGSVVSFMLPNWHEAAVIYHAATLAGMVAQPILPSLRDHDLRFMLADAGSRILFVPAEIRGFDYRAMMTRVADALPAGFATVVVRGDPGPHLAYEQLEGCVPAKAGTQAVLPPSRKHSPELDPDDVRMVMYTSGTTGRPKGVMHTHNSLNAVVRQIGRHWLVEPGDRFLVPSPVSHIGGSIYAFEMPLLLGTAAVLMERWEPEAAVALMRAEGCTHMAGATPFLQGLLAAARAAGTRLPDLKVVICGGAAVPPALVRDAADISSGRPLPASTDRPRCR